MDLTIGEYQLINLAPINILLGKNGCGKSTLLKQISNHLSNKQEYGKVKYINPERGGVLTTQANINQQMLENPNNLSHERNRNQVSNFRQQTVAQFLTFELQVLRDLESDVAKRHDNNFNFQAYIEQINYLLDNIYIKRTNKGFDIYSKSKQNVLVSPNDISSGESELITLTIECLVFIQECSKDKINILLLDEPDVHLHPDLQTRLSHFIYELVKDKENVKIIVATHSTSFIGALENYDFANIEFMKFNQKNFEFKTFSDEYKKILPIFGAHPLSNVFNEKPPLLVEGEDDERIWQQAVRTSNNKLKIYPCSVDGQGQMSKYESDVNNIISCIYDNAKAYSLRDKDDIEEGGINYLGAIKRFRLTCRASENLLLCDDVLKSQSITWEEIKSKIDEWIEKNPQHKYLSHMNSFKNSGYDRKNHNLKDIRNILLSFIHLNKAWEVLVGQCIGKMFSEGNVSSKDEHSLYAYLGTGLLMELGLKTIS